MPRRALLILVVALVVLRLAVVASVGDVFGYGEEFAKGAAAKAMLDGLPVEHHQLAYVHHEGGGFVVTHLKALLFALMGQSVLANKVAAILTTVLLLVAGIAFAREHLSELAAVLFALCFALAPLNYVRFSLLSLGTHFEALLFVLLVLHFTLRLVRPSDAATGGERAQLRDAIWLGLSGGFGLYFSLQLVPALLASAIWILVRWRGRIWRRETAVALASFAVGALPLWIMLGLVGREALVVRGEDGPSDGPGFFGALFGMLAPIQHSHDLFTWAQAIAFLIAIGAGVLARWTAAHTLSFLYLDIYALAYAASGLAFFYAPDSPGAWFFLLRLAPFWLFATLFAAFGIATLWESGGRNRRVAAGLLLVVVLVSGVRDFVQLCRAGRPSAPLENLALVARTKGYAYVEYFDKLQDHIEGGLADKCRVLRAFQDDTRALAPAIAQSLFEHAHEPPARAVEQCREWFGADAPAAWRGLGGILHTDHRYDVPAAFALLESLPEDAREPLAEALGRTGVGPRFRADRLEEQIAVPVPEPWREPWLRGVGWRLHFTFRFRPDLARAFIERRDPSQREALQRGYDEARAIDSL